jgi:hypothetical protein
MKFKGHYIQVYIMANPGKMIDTTNVAVLARGYAYQGNLFIIKARESSQASIKTFSTPG